MEREIINAGPAPAAPYSHAVRFGDLVFAAGQIGTDPQTGRLVGGGIEAETRQTLQNLATVLEAAGSSLRQVLSVTVFIVDMAGDYAPMNAVYREFFSEAPPARATVAVSALTAGARVEIQVIAARS